MGRRKLTNLAWLVFFTFIFLLRSVNAITFEKGDALFSKGFLGNLAGHSMVYLYCDEIDGPKNLSSHWLVEAVEPGEKARQVKLTGRSFWDDSSFTKGTPSFQQRQNIVLRAKQLRGKDYPENLELLYMYKGPKYRCDGLLEDAYEHANPAIDIVPGDTVVLTPRTQYEAMQQSKVIAPTVQVLNPTPNGVVNDNVNIQASVSDVSGIAKVEFWDGAPGSGRQIAMVESGTNNIETNITAVPTLKG